MNAHNNSKILALVFGFSLSFAFACDSESPAANPADDVAQAEQQFRSGARNWCDVYTCEPCPSTGCPPGGHAVTYCCPGTGGCNASHEVPAGTTCPDGKFLVICNWGQTNRDGSFTCYDSP